MDDEDVLISFEVNIDLADELDQLLHDKGVKIGEGIGTLMFILVQRELEDSSSCEEFQFRINLLHHLMNKMAVNSYEHEKQETEEDVKH